MREPTETITHHHHTSSSSSSSSLSSTIPYTHAVIRTPTGHPRTPTYTHGTPTYIHGHLRTCLHNLIYPEAKKKIPTVQQNISHVNPHPESYVRQPTPTPPTFIVALTAMFRPTLTATLSHTPSHTQPHSHPQPHSQPRRRSDQINLSVNIDNNTGLNTQLAAGSHINDVTD
ncbi:hypothetical protein Hamer_G020894, partial [Homarus americanus]